MERPRVDMAEWVAMVALCVGSPPMLTEGPRLIVARRIGSAAGRTGLRRSAVDGVGRVWAMMSAWIGRAADLEPAMPARAEAVVVPTRLFLGMY